MNTGATWGRHEPMLPHRTAVIVEPIAAMRGHDPDEPLTSVTPGVKTLKHTPSEGEPTVDKTNPGWRLKP